MDRRRDIPVLFFPHPVIWAVLGLFLILDMVWARLTGFVFHMYSNGDGGINLSIPAGLAAVFTLAVMARGKWPNLSRALFSFLFLAFLIKAGLMMNYLGAHEAFPLIDAALHRMDVMLGFDWMAHVTWVNSHPAAVSMLVYVYQKIAVALTLVFFILAIARDARRLHEYVTLWFLSVMVVNICSVFLPAAGAYAFLHPSADVIGNMPDMAGRYWLKDFMALRSGEMTSASFGHVTGIVAFPSFHAIAALLTTWVLRDRKIFFWPFAIFNLISMVSAISIGGHYLADLIGGTVTLGLSILIYRAWETGPARAAKANRPQLAAEGGAGA